MNTQLPLVLRWPPQQRFEAFEPGANGAAVDVLRAIAAGSGGFAYLAGPVGSGRSHLLIATCAAATAGGRQAQYLPASALVQMDETAAAGLGGCEVVAVDDVDALAGSAAGERALFALYNRCRLEGAGLVLAAGGLPEALGVQLPDLVSRLAACTRFTLRPLPEDARRALLRRRAGARGIVLDEPVLDWLFARRKRDLGSLLALLERIDAASLAAQRRVTIPFLSRLLQDDAA